MSDGGVVTCMPLLNIMDKLPVVEEKTLCGGNSDTKVAASSISTNNKLPESQPAKPSASQPPKKKKIVKVIRKVVRRKPKERKDQDKKSEVLQGKGCNKEENGGDSGFKDEVEEGELNSHADLETGEISPVKSLRNSEIEKGEISGDCSNLQYDKSYVERMDLPADKYRKEEREIRSWRDPGDEIEKGEFIPDRWHKMDTRKDDHSYNRSRRSGVDRETTWKYDYDYEHERTPPGGRFSNEDTYRRREFRSGNDRATRVSSKIVIEESLHNNDPNNLGKEYSSTVNKLKRHGAEHLYADHGDYGSSKYRKLSDDCSRSLHPNHYSRNSVERETTEIPIHLKTHLWKSILKSIMTHISVPGLFQTDMVHDLICPHTTGLGTMATGIEVPTIGKGRHMPGRDRHISLRSLHMLVKGLHMTAAITMIVEEVQVTLNGPVIAGMELLNIWKIPRAIVPDVMAIEI
ncbi:histone-lysine N-methyltransferase ATXR3-like [Brassica napus]|uniref:histone-lysine N-methyltransferase ATXR3-like n=1 Tax=Brassica napus TaxID=3708 RepID=UPI002078D480|nr:histone-lysine N-methyltransferase ATXR3-like [Brassica napus]